MKTTSRLFLLCLYLALPLVNGYCNDDVVAGKQTNSAEHDRKAGDSMVLIIKDVEYVFRWCPPGTFMMGSPAKEPGRSSNETQHKVTLTQGFWMLETQVTQAMWESVMGNNPSHFKGEKLPVETISWNDSMEYIKKLNELGIAPAGFKFSLPTESQWEYACRAGTTAAYHFGNTLTQKQANANFGIRGSVGKTTEVGAYPANAWGLRDVHGNVWEWCADWYGQYSISTTSGGTVTDPTGQQHGTYRVVRGGSSGSHVWNCRSALRSGDSPTSQFAYCGFRLSLVRID